MALLTILKQNHYQKRSMDKGHYLESQIRSLIHVEIKYVLVVSEIQNISVDGEYSSIYWSRENDDCERESINAEWWFSVRGWNCLCHLFIGIVFGVSWRDISIIFVYILTLFWPCFIVRTFCWRFSCYWLRRKPL